ncbi:MAG: 4,5-dihydroxyphthalate decarboxylase [Solirubrobacteraceae bacterium]
MAGERISGRENVHLTLAINDYDHVRDLVTGAVPVEGIDLTCLTLSVEEIFWRFSRHREWEVSEMSLAKYCSLRAGGDDSITAIPVFPSRSFRHSAIFIREDGPLDDPAALAGARIGVPEWTQTATVWARGLLQHQYGIDLTNVRWVRGGTNQPGRVEGIKLYLPERFDISNESDRSLNDLLLAGEIAALICPHPPDELERRSGRVVRLFSDYRTVEEGYFRETGIFPPMHVIALRSDAVERHPWIAMNLFEAFTEAKRRGVARAIDPNTPRYPVPWSFANAHRAEELMGEDLWPYGIEPNRTALRAFLGMAYEQGVCARLLEPEELFAPQVLDHYVI